MLFCLIPSHRRHPQALTCIHEPSKHWQDGHRDDHRHCIHPSLPVVLYTSTPNFPPHTSANQPSPQFRPEFTTSAMSQTQPSAHWHKHGTVHDLDPHEQFCAFPLVNSCAGASPAAESSSAVQPSVIATAAVAPCNHVQGTPHRFHHIKACCCVTVAHKHRCVQENSAEQPCQWCQQQLSQCGRCLNRASSTSEQPLS